MSSTTSNSQSYTTVSKPEKTAKLVVNHMLDEEKKSIDFRVDCEFDEISSPSVLTAFKRSFSDVFTKQSLSPSPVKTIRRNRDNNKGYTSYKVSLFSKDESEPALSLELIENFCPQCLKCNVAEEKDGCGCSWHGDNSMGKKIFDSVRYELHTNGIPNKVFALSVVGQTVNKNYRTNEEGTLCAGFPILDDLINTMTKPGLFTSLEFSDKINDTDKKIIFDALTNKNMNSAKKTRAKEQRKVSETPSSPTSLLSSTSKKNAGVWNNNTVKENSIEPDTNSTKVSLEVHSDNNSEISSSESAVSLGQTSTVSEKLDISMLALQDRIKELENSLLICSLEKKAVLAELGCALATNSLMHARFGQPQMNQNGY
jgi:hypothetical protein